MRPVSVGRPILVFGLLGGALTVLLKTIEYRYLVIEHSVEIYGVLVAAVFAALGIWLGFTLTKKPESVVVKEFVGEPPGPFRRNEVQVERLGLTPREVQILELIASGLSNKEIAERIFVSENTVKTHLSRLFEKLNARRRTQAVQLGKELGILP
jgi:DNA-binding CsgD family transcriptional regulator